MASIYARQVMRLRRAVLQTPARSSVPPMSPIHKPRLLPTPSKSTLPQRLIPLHFNSFISNTYKKPGRGSSFPLQSFTIRHSPLAPSAANKQRVCAPTGIAATPFRSYLYFMTPVHPGWGAHLSPISVASALESTFQRATTSARTRKPIPVASTLVLFTTRYPPFTLSKVRFTHNPPGATHV